MTEASRAIATTTPVLCPLSGTPGRPVKPITVGSLVVPAQSRLAARHAWFHCDDPACDVVYFSEDGARLGKVDLSVRVGSKETTAPRLVCYCFGHTLEDLEADVKRAGSSSILDLIKDKCRQGLERCEETNPQGSCCLGNVRRALTEAQARLGAATGVARRPAGAATDTAAAAVVAEAGSGSEPACCASAATVAIAGTPPGVAAGNTRRVGIWATGGAVVAAVLSSACCWLPLLLISFGLSAAGVASVFEAYRPWLLGTTALLLADGFYLVYFRRVRCAPSETCAIPNRRLVRFNKSLLWIASGVVLALVMFPNYADLLLRGEMARTPATGAAGTELVFRIEGMTCAACATTLRSILASLPGVDATEVSFELGTAHLTADPVDARQIETEVLRVVAEAGYRASRAGE